MKYIQIFVINAKMEIYILLRTFSLHFNEHPADPE